MAMTGISLRAAKSSIAPMAIAPPAAPARMAIEGRRLKFANMTPTWFARNKPNGK
jgi:hypothetical protein